MEFKRYQHVERLGNDAVEGLLNGTVYLMPKIDGTNGSVWVTKDFRLSCASRNRVLELGDDNQGFCHWVVQNRDKFIRYFALHPTHILYGEWLVPHTLRAYRKEAWRDFYVFDVYDYATEKYVHYSDYSHVLEDMGITYVPVLSYGENLTENQIIKQLEDNTYLLDDGRVQEGIRGEGLVIKNYDFVNRFGHVVWGKLVRGEFKEKHRKENVLKIGTEQSLEKSIVEMFLTETFLEKEYAKMLETAPWSSKRIGEYLGRVWHEFVTEEIFAILKKYKNPTIDFKNLQHEVTDKIKKDMSRLF